MPGEEKSDCVKVAVRCRPLSSKELGTSERNVVEIEPNMQPDGTGSVKITDPEGKEKLAEFAFDLVFGMDCLQEQVYEAVGRISLDSTMTGYNCTIFAYGQTGSGKSWCMTGGAGDLKGIIPRVNEALFLRISEAISEQSSRRFLVSASFFEIYQEIIFDLLNPCQDRTKLGAGLQVKEHPVLGIYVKDLQEIVVDNAAKLENLMISGTKNRAVSSTLMNSVSSRSHSIFTIKVHQKDDEDKSKNVFAKLNLVDLAGSERQKGTGASGQTLKEGANINKSLSALGNVINALVENANGKKVFVPFRNSKLTRVLQESLGGNSLCTMLATMSPAACNYEETVSTLRYANRAKAIKVSATKNEEASQISRLNAEIEELKKKLGGGGGGGVGDGLMAEEERREMRQKFQAQLAEMQQMVGATWEEKARISAEHEAQLNKARDEHRRQAKAMLEECQKRLRLLQEHNDLELTIRGLLDTINSLPARADADQEVAPASHALRSGQLLRQWLKMVASTAEVVDALKQQHTMAIVFLGAFREDLTLWVDGEEAPDHAMARTGARRALTKLETLRRECGKLCDLEEQGMKAANEFGAVVSSTKLEWTSGGSEALLNELRQAAGAGDEDTAEEGDLQPLYTYTLQDIGRIMQLVEKQATAKAEELKTLAALNVGPSVELVLRGSKLVPGVTIQGTDLDLLGSLLPRGGGENGTSSSSPKAATTPTSAAKGSAGLLPKEQRALHDWTPEDVDESVEGTEVALKQLVDLDGLNKKKSASELLARPPPKFVHDVAVLVKNATGFLQTLPEEWPEPREARIDILQHIADSVTAALGLKAVDFDPENVLRGKQVAQTLKLFQLLAIAAARERQQPGSGVAVAVAAPGQRQGHGTGAGQLTNARDMPHVLETVARCIQAVVEGQESRPDRDSGGGHCSPTREIESNWRTLQGRLEEEEALGKKREEKLVKLKQDLEHTRSIVAERHVQLEDARKAVTDIDVRKQALRKQVNEARNGLLQRAEEVSGNPEILRLKNELKENAAKLSGKNAVKLKLASDVKRLQQKSIETSSQKETWDLEVRHMKLRTAEGLDGPLGHVSDDILVLQAEKQKWDLRVQALEEKVRSIAESDDANRQRETALIEEKNIKGRNIDDVQMQLQVVMEERDGLRDGMDLLWQEKTRVDEELETVTEGYVNLTDRLSEKTESNMELEDQIRKLEDQLRDLLREDNVKRTQAAIDTAQAQSTSSPPRPPPPVIASPPAPGEAAGAQQAEKPAIQKDLGEEDEDPHYSEDEASIAPVLQEAAATKEKEEEESNYTDDFEAPEPEE